MDGRLDESVWNDLPVLDSMSVVIPDTLAPASHRTETRIFYNQRGIYVGVINHQPPDSLIARMSSRDQQLERDSYTLAIDPSGEGLYGYLITINLGDTFTDGTILPERQISLQWDGAWNAVTADSAQGWTAEIYIPWSMMALPQSGLNRRIGIYTERKVAYLNETWAWPALPITENEFLSAFQKFELQGINPVRQLTYYPFASSTFDNRSKDTSYRVGTDLYWRPSSNLQVTASLNPDFGAVESDDVIVQLDAFENYFPDKRAFFLEGQEIFITSPRAGDDGGPSSSGPRSGRGGQPTTMLYTRRIGASPDFQVPDGVVVDPRDSGAPTDLLGAAKITGQAGNWRYGTLMAVEDNTLIHGLTDAGERIGLEAEGRDFLVGRLLYEDTSGGGRRALGWMGTHLAQEAGDATVNGIDMHYFSADARWVADAQWLFSDVSGETGAGMFFDVSYVPQRGTLHRIAGDYLGEDLDFDDLGFYRRTNNIGLEYQYRVTDSNLEGLRDRSRSITFRQYVNEAGDPVRSGIYSDFDWTFLNNQSLGLSFNYFPSRVEDILSRGNGSFRIPERYDARITWNSDRSLPVSLSGRFFAQQEWIGKRRLTGGVGLNWRPQDHFSLQLILDRIDREGWLVNRGGGNLTAFETREWAPKINMDYFLSAKQQLRFSLQWVGIQAFEDTFYRVDQQRLQELLELPERPTAESQNFNINRMTFQARYRWELAPLSDLFLVYTRGSNLPRDTFEDTAEQFRLSWTNRIVDTWVLKLRYRIDG